MINAQGLDEAGIDGGGIFREFMSQLVKQAFDPSYGFFKTTSEQLLYPNPHVSFFPINLKLKTPKKQKQVASKLQRGKTCGHQVPTSNAT